MKDKTTNNLEKIENEKQKVKNSSPVSATKELQVSKPLSKSEKSTENDIKKEISPLPEIKKNQDIDQKSPNKESIEKKKKVTKIIARKNFASAFGNNMPISKKQAVYICSFIKGKNIDSAIFSLQRVIDKKIAVPFKGEIPHRKGKGMMSGRYPAKASKLFINLLKGLKGNTIVNGMDSDNSVIYLASASWASRPLRRNRRQFKRTNVILESKEVKI
jgi:ribosomal protein L22